MKIITNQVRVKYNTNKFKTQIKNKVKFRASKYLLIIRKKKSYQMLVEMEKISTVITIIICLKYSHLWHKIIQMGDS